MNTAELKKLEEACENAEHMMAQGHKRHQAQSALKDLVTHESISELLAINAELVDALKDLASGFHSLKDSDFPALGKARATLAKAKGGEL